MLPCPVFRGMPFSFQERNTRVRTGTEGSFVIGMVILSFDFLINICAPEEWNGLPWPLSPWSLDRIRFPSSFSDNMTKADAGWEVTVPLDAICRENDNRFSHFKDIARQNFVHLQLNIRMCDLFLFQLWKFHREITRHLLPGGLQRVLNPNDARNSKKHASPARPAERSKQAWQLLAWRGFVLLAWAETA